MGLIELDLEGVEPDMIRVAKRVSDHQRAYHRKLIGISLTEDIRVGPAMIAFRERNIRLITSLGEDTVDQVRGILADAESTGLRVEDLAEQIRERFDVARSRAELIARDQTLKLHGQVTKIRQENAGIVSYTWSTSRDGRVRESHEALEGEEFSWNSPPEPGHPGDDYQCRCVAIPVLPS